MKTSTYQRMQQSVSDQVRNRRARIDAAFKRAGLTADNGGYPTNPDEKTAYNAGFQRGCHWAYQAAALHATGISERWDMADSTAAGQGEQDGWNAAVKAIGETASDT